MSATARDAIAGLCGMTSLAVLVFGAGASCRKARKYRSLRAGLRAEGQVLHTYTLPGDQGRPAVPCSVVTFQAADGQKFVINDRSGRSRAVSDRVPVVYPPGRPQHAVLDDLPKGMVGSAVVVILGACFAAACLFTAAWELTRH